MKACGRLIARMGEQDVDCDIGAGIDLDDGTMAPLTRDFGDPAINERYLTARQIGPDVGGDVVTIAEDSQPVGPIVKQPDLIHRLRAGPDEAPMLVSNFEAVAIGTWDDGCAPVLGKTRDIRHLVNNAIAQDQAARAKGFTIASEDGKIVDGTGDAAGAGIDHPDSRVARELLPRRGQDVGRWLVIMAEHTVRAASEAVALKAGVENDDFAAGTTKLQSGGEAGKAAADDDDVIHRDGLRVGDRGRWAWPGAPCEFMILSGILMKGLRYCQGLYFVTKKNSQTRRGRPINEALGQTIVDAACELFVELGFQATTLDKVAQRAKISKLSIYRHFENKEALFGAAMAAGCQQLFAPQALLEGVDGSVEDQLMAVGSSLLRTLLRSDVRSLEAMVMADKTSQNALSKLHFEAGPAHVIARIEALLRQLHAKALLNVPDPLRSARLFAALFKGSDLLMIARFDEARAEDDNEIESYCRSAVAMFIAAHSGIQGAISRL